MSFEQTNSPLTDKKQKQTEEQLESSQKIKRTPLSIAGEFILIIIGSLVLGFCIQAVLVKPFKIPSGSMIPTLNIKDHILVDRFSKNFSDFKNGDIVVFKAPKGALEQTCAVNHSVLSSCPMSTHDKGDIYYVKRIVGEPGDKISIEDGKIYRNGKLEKEAFIIPDKYCEICNLPKPITVPEGYFFVAGDNRGQSNDSRVWGPVAKDSIIGKVRLIYWPPSHLDSL